MEKKRREKKKTPDSSIHGITTPSLPNVYPSPTIAIGMTSRGKTSPKLRRDNRAGGSAAKTISIVAAINAMKMSAGNIGGRGVEIGGGRPQIAR